MCFLDGETKHYKPIYKTLNPNQQYYKKLSFSTEKKKCSTCTNKDHWLNLIDATLLGFFLHEV